MKVFQEDTEGDDLLSFLLDEEGDEIIRHQLITQNIKKSSENQPSEDHPSKRRKLEQDCRICGVKIRGTNAHLLRHIVSIHSCPVCPQKFQDNKEKRKHLMEMHR